MILEIMEKQVDFTPKASEEYGILINSNDFNDLTSEEAKKKLLKN